MLDPAVEAALAQLRDALSRQAGRHVLFLELLYDDGSSDRLSVPHATPAEPGDATPTEAAILRVLARAEAPLKGRAIALRAGLPYSSHFRRVLSEMLRAGRLVRGDQGGYALP